MERKEFQLNEVIFKEDDDQMWMYSICAGAVDIYSGYDTDKSKKLATLTEGQFFGEIGMIGMMPRTATAVAAAEQVVLEIIRLDDLEDYLKNHPENLQPIMSNVSGRIRELTETLSEITRITNDALGKGESTLSGGKWIAEHVRKLLGILKDKEISLAEYTAKRRMVHIAYGEIPPICRYCAGDVIFSAGDKADCMYEIYEGTVGIYTDYKTKNEKLLTELRSGDVFGEMGILDDKPRSAAAVCLADCSVLMVRKENFMLFFQKKPGNILRILRQMCRRLRDLTETYLQVCKTFEELPSPEQIAFDEDMTLAKLQYFRDSQLYSSLYDISGSTGWMPDYF